MTAVLDDPASALAVVSDPAEVVGADPYGLGFAAESHVSTATRDITIYDLGSGRTGYISFGARSGHAVVIREADGREPFASAIASADEARRTVTRYIR